MADGDYIGRHTSVSNAVPVKVKTTTPLQRMQEALELGRRFGALARRVRRRVKTEPDPLRRAERVAATAAELGIQTAVIGALAMVAHQHVHVAQDDALATSVDMHPHFHDLAERLRHLDLSVTLFASNEGPHAGVLRVWDQVDPDGDPLASVDIVNFRNSQRPEATAAQDAIRKAVTRASGSALRFVTLPDLVALKLLADSLTDHYDIVALLQCNPDADLDEIRAVAGPFDRQGKLEELIAAARTPRR